MTGRFEIGLTIIVVVITMLAVSSTLGTVVAKTPTEAEINENSEVNVMGRLQDDVHVRI